MKYENRMTLQDGRTCIIRSASANDAEEVLDNFNLTHRETDYLLTRPQENHFDAVKERRFLQDKENSSNEAELCAVVDGRIVGTAGISQIGSQEKIRHRAEFGISIAKDYWHLGIGRALTEACLTCASQAGYRQLELQAVKENVYAIALYQSLGFVEYGRNPRGMYSRYTGWQEIVLMRAELDPSMSMDNQAGSMQKD